MKKQYIKPAIALALVATVAIGGTLAYLTDQTDTVTNTFTTDEAIGITLKETVRDYVLTPGTTLDKDPTITVDANESYVFIEVVETIPTAALGESTTQYTFADYVVYTINAGGTIYQWSDTTSAMDYSTSYTWKWLKVSDTVVDDTNTYDSTSTGYTTYTTVYALVNDSDDSLLAISSLTEMDNPETTGESDAYITADFPILKDDSVTIPTTLTPAMLALLLNADTTADTTDIYEPTLAFTGYAIQTTGLVAEDGNPVTELIDIYTLATGGTVSTPSTT